MTKAERLKLLTECAPGTLMGRLLRQFWQPVALSEPLATGTARAVRIMGEDLTLFRGTSGNAYLVAGRCAHRCSVLHTGWVEDDELRCMYHGWRYDGTGQCTERPAEKRAPRELVRIAAYPVHEWHGLIFAWLGEGPAPEFELPRKPCLEDPGSFTFAREQVWDCNWFQQVENSLDALHVSFVHVWGRMSRFGEEITTAIPKLSYTETSAGIRQIATRSRTNQRVSDWTFPNNNHIVGPGPRKTDPWVDTCVWVVPIDEESTRRFTISAVPSTDPETCRRIAADRDPDYDPVAHYDRLFGQHLLPDTGAAQIIATQDYVAVRGQGRIVDRLNERLGRSDAGIALLRRIFQRELDALRQGCATKQWTRLEEAATLPIPQAAMADV